MKQILSHLLTATLIALAAMEAMGTLTPEIEAQKQPEALKNEDMPDAARALVKELETIAETAKHAADPRTPAATMAAVLAAYFRTPD